MLAAILRCFPKQCTGRGSSCYLKVSALVLDGVSAFSRVFSPSQGLDSPCTPSWMVCPPSWGSWLPVDSLCTPSWMVCLPSWGSSLPLYPFLAPFVLLLGWCVHLLEGLDSQCTPALTPCRPLIGWCPPSQGSWLAVYLFLDGVSAFLTVLTHIVPLLGCVSAFLRVLSSRVSHGTAACSPNSVLLGFLNAFLRCPPWCVRLLQGLDSLCTPSWLPLYPFLDGAFAVSGVLTPSVTLLGLAEGFWFPLYPFLIPFVHLLGWCVRLLKGFESHWIPLLDSLCTASWMVSTVSMVCLVSGGTWLHCNVCPPSRGSGLPHLPLLGWCVRLSEGLELCPLIWGSWLPLSPFFNGVSAFPSIVNCMFTPSCGESWLPLYPFLDDVSAYPKVLTPSSIWIKYVRPIGCFFHGSLAFTVATKQTKPK